MKFNSYQSVLNSTIMTIPSKNLSTYM